jgi:hypothetical protein
MSFAGEAIAMQAYWKKHFGDWRRFAVTSEMRTLIKEAAKEWADLAHDLAAVTLPEASSSNDEDAVHIMDAIPEFLRRTKQITP